MSTDPYDYFFVSEFFLKIKNDLGLVISFIDDKSYNLFFFSSLKGK